MKQVSAIMKISTLFNTFFISAIIIASIVLYLPVFQWLQHKISLDYGYLHLFALLIISGLALHRLRAIRHNPFHMPSLYHPALLIWPVVTVLYLLNEAMMGMRSLSALLFVAYLYGLAGHFVTKRWWQSMFLPMLLTLLILPFEHYLDVYLGFPLRLLSAEWAGSVLSFAHIPTLSTESILMIDNRAAIVDLDCSGINSLWIGSIFYLLLTWIERYKITPYWLFIGLLLLLLLVIANVFRIVILVFLDLVLHLPELAAVLHQFLGLLGFVIACGIAWGLLHYFAPISNTVTAGLKHHKTPPSSHPLIPASAILSLILVFALLYQPMAKQPINKTTHYIQLPAHYQSKEAALSVQERDFFANNHAQIQKLSFTLQTANNNKRLSGSMIFVWSRYWKTQHVPENCYLGQGFSITEKGVWQLAKQTHIRFLALNRPQQTESEHSTTMAQTGLYWFQSAHKRTPDYSSRVMDGLFNRDDEWVMVSILWDEAISMDSVAPFITELQTHIAGEFKANEYQ